VLALLHVATQATKRASISIGVCIFSARKL
jgi:hypothetical protein